MLYSAAAVTLGNGREEQQPLCVCGRGYYLYIVGRFYVRFAGMMNYSQNLDLD